MNLNLNLSLSGYPVFCGICHKQLGNYLDHRACWDKTYNLQRIAGQIKTLADDPELTTMTKEEWEEGMKLLRMALRNACHMEEETCEVDDIGVVVNTNSCDGGKTCGCRPIPGGGCRRTVCDSIIVDKTKESYERWQKAEQVKRSSTGKKAPQAYDLP